MSEHAVCQNRFQLINVDFKRGDQTLEQYSCSGRTLMDARTKVTVSLERKHEKGRPEHDFWQQYY